MSRKNTLKKYKIRTINKKKKGGGKGTKKNNKRKFVKSLRINKRYNKKPASKSKSRNKNKVEVTPIKHPTHYYHFSPVSNRDTINTNGLQIGQLQTINFDENNPDQVSTKIYLLPDFNELHESYYLKGEDSEKLWMNIYCNVIARLENKDLDLWRVKNNKGYILPFSDMPYEYYSSNNIPVEDIELVAEDIWPITSKNKYPKDWECPNYDEFVKGLRENQYMNGNNNELNAPYNIM